MNKRGQAALEYLMTYGWALIVIAIVVGVLIFIVSSPAGGVQCSSSDPVKILFKSSNITAGAGAATTTNVINIQNATGGSLSDVANFSALGSFTTGAAACTGCTNGETPMGTSSTAVPVDGNISSLVSGGNIYLFPTYTVASGGTLQPSSYTVAYKDQFGYYKTATITCQGKVA